MLLHIPVNMSLNLIIFNIYILITRLWFFFKKKINEIRSKKKYYEYVVVDSISDYIITITEKIKTIPIIYYIYLSKSYEL